MVGQFDISCFGKIADRTSNVTIDPLFRGFKYIFHHQNRIKLLHYQIERLSIEEEKMSRKVAAEVASGKELDNKVLKWQKDVEEIQESAKIFLEKHKNRHSWRCIQHLTVLSPVANFQLGRDAVNLASKMTKLTDYGKLILADEIAWFPLENTKTDRVFQNFESRKDAFEILWQGIVSEGSPRIIGIYGMPGIGKTRMTEQISKEAKEKGIFDKVIQLYMGYDWFYKVIQLQDRFAESLNIHFVSQNDVDHRAHQLKYSFMNLGKSLIILHDVGGYINLEFIGIPSGYDSSSRGCKILLTSREKEVCLLNKCEHIAEIKTLTPCESWDLFSNIVGTKQIDSIQDESLAKELCNECGGLPLLLCAFGKALKSMPRNSWMGALSKLKNDRFENIPDGINPRIYACLKLCFDNLEEDAKACLLLCSLFPEDDDIPIRNLIQLAKGSQLVSDGRSGVLNMVDILVSSSMLLKVEDNRHVKLADMIRDVTRSIACRDPKYSFQSVRCGSRLPDRAGYDYGTRKVLHLDLYYDGFNFPDDLSCPHLHTLSLRSVATFESQVLMQAPAISKFANLRCLMLNNFSIGLHFCLPRLIKLRSLLLEHCNLFRPDVWYFPENLETLCIWDCRLPEKLHLPDMKCLRTLEILGGASEVVFVPNDMYHNLHEFDMRIGGAWGYTHAFEPLSTRLIELSGDIQFECFEDLVGMAEEVTLRSTNGTLSSIRDRNREAFAHLRYMHIEECHNLEYIADISDDDDEIEQRLQWLTSRDEIEESLQRPISFSKLTILYISRCRAIKYLFCGFIAKCLLQLQQLSIHDCPLMEVIVMNEGTAGADIINFFSKLQSLKLRQLPRLTSFYKEYKHVHSSSKYECLMPALVNIEVESVYKEYEDMHFSSRSVMDNKTITLFHLRSVILEDLPNFKSFIHGANYQWHMPAVEEVQVDNCKLSTLFTCSVFRIPQLKYLQVSNCKLLEHIIENPRENEISDSDKIITHSQLSNVILKNLPELKSFMHSSKYECLMPALVNVEVENCGLSSLFTSNVFKNLQQLQQLKILNCASFEKIVEDGRGDEPSYMDKKIITLSQLKSVILKNLATLKSFIHSTKYEYLMPALVNVEVENCGLSSLFTSNVFKNLQKLHELKILNCALLKEIVEDGRGDEPSYMEKKTITLSQLESVVLKDLQKLKSFMHSAEYEYQMPALLEVEVENCGLSSLFTSNVFKNLQHLQQLKISNCASLKEIVEDGRGEPSYLDKKSITLSQLKSVILKNLATLKSFIHSTKYEYLMPALLEVEVDNCGLFTLFTSNVLKNLQKLRELRVSNCIWLEDIVAEVRDDETFYKSVSVMKIPRLSTITLNNLPKLKCFSRAAKYVFEMHALYTLRLCGCPLIEKFTSNETSTGLVSVYTDWQDGEEVSNLNDYIKQNCRRLGSPLSNSAGESSSSYKPDKEAVGVEEEQPLQEKVASDQKVLKIELQIYINSQQEVTDTKTSVHHKTPQE